MVISDFIKLIKTQDLARVFFAAGRKKKKKQPKNKNVKEPARWRNCCTIAYIGMYDGHCPRALSHYTVIILIRTAFSSGSMTQIGINSVCNH